MRNVSFKRFFVDLMKHKRYEIRMSVYNAVGEGPTSSPQEVFVGEAGKSFIYELLYKSPSC